MANVGRKSIARTNNKGGIATELKAELNYTGRFDYSYGGFEGTFKDRKGLCR